MEGDRVLIRVGFMDASKIYCDVDLKNLTKASFLNDVAEVAEIEENAEIKIFDNEDVEVPLRHLKRVIKKYEKSIRFSLRIEPLNSGDWMDQHAVDMLKDLKTFLMKNGFNHLLPKKGDVKILTKKERESMIREICNMIKEKSGLYPNTKRKSTTARVLNHIFPDWQQEKILNSLNHWFKNERSRIKAEARDKDTKSGEKQRKCDTKGSAEPSTHCVFLDREDDMGVDYLIEDSQDNEECDVSHSVGSNMDDDYEPSLVDVGSTVDLTNEL